MFSQNRTPDTQIGEIKMLETKDLILDKAKFSDWEGMYLNVWSHPESARYMLWRVTTSESDAKVRIQKPSNTRKTMTPISSIKRRTANPSDLRA